MKKFLLFICVAILFADCEKPSDCIKSTGAMQSKIYNGLAFTKIMARNGIAVVLKQGADSKVEVRSGANLINDIQVDLQGDMLILTDNTTCNWTRGYGETTVYITAPNITDIYSKTQNTIISDGVLAYQTLHLISMDPYDGYPGVGTGDFILQVQCENFSVANNNVSRYFITGTANKMEVSFYESGGIFHGENLIGNSIKVYHRGTNDLVFHPIDAITGDIYNIGNVICVNHPPVAQVTPHYKGRLIFY